MDENKKNSIENEDTIDLWDLAKVLLKKAWILVLVFVVVFAGSYYMKKKDEVKIYRASSMIYVYGKSTSITSLADIQIGSQMTIDFQIIATTRDVIEAAAADIGLNLPYEAVVGKVSIENPDGSHILRVTATDSDPVVACNLSNSVANQLRIRIADVMNTDKPSVVESAIVPKSPIGTNTRRQSLTYALAVTVAVALFLVVRHLMDDTIKTEEDVEKYLGLNVLAVVPSVSTIATKRRRRRRRI